MSSGATAICIDIETIPSQLKTVRDYVADGVKHPANIKKKESIDKWYEEKHDAAIQDALRKCSLDGSTNHIICIGFGSVAGDSNSFYCEDPVKNEADMIETFFSFILDGYGNYAHDWVGHNISSFDLRIIRQRCIVLGVKWPAIFDRAFKDKWGDAVFDTMLRWSGDKRDMISLDKLCMALGVPTPKGDITGANVYDAWLDGRHNEVREYCSADVEATLECYKKMKEAGL